MMSMLPLLFGFAALAGLIFVIARIRLRETAAPDEFHGEVEREP